MTIDSQILDASPAAIEKAAKLLRDGGLVAFPTETVYGLGADARNDQAIAAIFEAKNRPSFNPLIVHVADFDRAAELVEFNTEAEKLADAFWPGALTLVLPRRADCGISLLVSAGLETLAVRVPNHPIAQDLMQASGCPIAAPSANRSESISPTTALHVAQSLGDAAPLILDGGPCQVGLESTVIDLSGQRPVLLRPGGVTIEDIEWTIGPLDIPAGDEKPKSPGMMNRHYAPTLPLRLNVMSPEPDEAFLAFGPLNGKCTANLSQDGNLTEAAANLFSMLRRLDTSDFTGIAVMPVPETGLGRAINDRLRRATATA